MCRATANVVCHSCDSVVCSPDVSACGTELFDGRVQCAVCQAKRQPKDGRSESLHNEGDSDSLSSGTSVEEDPERRDMVLVNSDDEKNVDQSELIQVSLAQTWCLKVTAIILL